MESLREQRHAIRTAMDYVVPDTHRAEADDVLDIYRDDRIGLQILLEFYSYPPEAKDDWICELRLVNHRQGIFLIAAITPDDGYLYLVSSEGIEFEGSMQDGFLSRDLLAFFDYDAAQDFERVCADPEALPVYEPLQQNEEICPACHVRVGECHHLGCPVEICPWCGGQLVYCSCRHDQLGVDVITSEQELARFEELLEERGRIPYSREQRPSFAADGPPVILD
ncbi:MAG: hypothetical protein ACOX5Z_03880 [Desulfobulbus sp.]